MILKIFVILTMIVEIFYFTDAPIGKDFKFDQTILSVGVPFYKLMMSLGSCAKTVLYEEEKAWRKVRYNRILDIYYKSSDPQILVSKVEIRLVIDNTDCFVYSRDGVGYAEFAATMYIPTRVSMIFYRLKIFTCSKAINHEETCQSEMSVNSQERQEELKIKQLPIHERPLRPDVGPDHIYYAPDPIAFAYPNKFDAEENASINIKVTTPLPLNLVDPLK